MVEIRPMTPDDVPASEAVWHEAWLDLRRRYHVSGLPEAEVTPKMAAHVQARLERFLATDPGGSFVAVNGERVVGLAQALVREDLWVLSLFGVAVDAQEQGVGRRLLDASLPYGEGMRGIIVASRDPRAARRYAAAGFTLHPAVTGWGRVKPEGLPAPDGVRPASVDDFEWMGAVDREVRGASHGVDFDTMAEDGCRFLGVGREGYVVVRGDRYGPLAAVDEDVAAALLAAALREAPTDTEVEVGWLTARQQWAIGVSLAAGLELHPVGPVFLRGFDEMPGPYLVSGTWG